MKIGYSWRDSEVGIVHSTCIIYRLTSNLLRSFVEQVSVFKQIKLYFGDILASQPVSVSYVLCQSFTLIVKIYNGF